MIHDIGIIIPVKDPKELPYLESLLEELCRQNEKYRLDIVIVAGTGMPSIVKSTYKLRERFEYVPPINIKEAEGTITDARNLGVKPTTGDVIIQMDCDNILNNDYAVHDLIAPILDQACVMSYTPVTYNYEEPMTEKELKLIKYNNFLLRFEFIPRIPFAIWKDVYEQVGGLEEKNTMMKFCGKILWYNPGGIKKTDIGTTVSPRHIIERAEKRQTKPSKSSHPLSPNRSQA